MAFKLPVMRCDSGCGECCGVAPATETEFRKVEEYVRQNGVEALDQGVTCPFYQGGKCAVYPVRPLACRLFGHSEGMVCPRGHNVNVPERKVRRHIMTRGLPTRTLHEMLGPDWEGLAWARGEPPVP